jgi:hypothetical protein
VSQASATFGAARIDHLATATGSHAGTETVSTGTLQIAGLKSTFHGRVPDTLIHDQWRPAFSATGKARKHTRN